MVSKSNQNSCLVFTQHRTPNAIRSDTERNLIGRRTQSDWTPNGIRSDGGRNPIGRRTESDRIAFG